MNVTTWAPVPEDVNETTNLSFAILPIIEIGAILVPTAVPDPLASDVAAKLEATGNEISTTVVVAVKVGVTLNVPLNVTWSPTLKYLPVGVAVEAVFAPEVIVGVDVPEAIPSVNVVRVVIEVVSSLLVRFSASASAGQHSSV